MNATASAGLAHGLAVVTGLSAFAGREGQPVGPARAGL